MKKSILLSAFFMLFSISMVEAEEQEFKETISITKQKIKDGYFRCDPKHETPFSQRWQYFDEYKADSLVQYEDLTSLKVNNQQLFDYTRYSPTQNNQEIRVRTLQLERLTITDPDLAEKASVEITNGHVILPILKRSNAAFLCESTRNDTTSVLSFLWQNDTLFLSRFINTPFIYNNRIFINGDIHPEMKSEKDIRTYLSKRDINNFRITSRTALPNKDEQGVDSIFYVTFKEPVVNEIVNVVINEEAHPELHSEEELQKYLNDNKYRFWKIETNTYSISHNGGDENNNITDITTTINVKARKHLLSFLPFKVEQTQKDKAK